jgi:Fe-S-cluster-containing hydrogenase component 2
MSKQLMIKPEKCLGCRTCEIICSYGKEGSFNPKSAAVSVIMYDKAAISVPVMCQQCEDACCVAVCPVGAMHRENDGTVKCDAQKCIVCKMCANACPLGNITVSPTTHAIIKCDECDGDPQCAKYCPTGCLVYAEESDSLGRRKAVADALKNVYGEEEDE